MSIPFKNSTQFPTTEHFLIVSKTHFYKSNKILIFHFDHAVKHNSEHSRAMMPLLYLFM